MKVEDTTDVAAGVDEIFQCLCDPAYYEMLATELERVSSVELVEVRDQGAGTTVCVVRYEAPTELPRFLRKWQERAPEVVCWDEVMVLDRERGEVSYRVVPDVPEHWHERYENQGYVGFEDLGRVTRVVRRMEFSVDVGALDYLVGRALKKEVRAVLAAQNAVLARRLQLYSYQPDASAGPPPQS